MTKNLEFNESMNKKWHQPDHLKSEKYHRKEFITIVVKIMNITVVDQKSKDKCHSKDKIIIILNLIIEEWKFKKFNNENNNEKWRQIDGQKLIQTMKQTLVSR